MAHNIPFVSIIIPNYNHAFYLEERIQSVLKQTYHNYEIIILDDKSTDNSTEIIERYRNNKKISKIIYNKDNSGSPFKQWKKGIELAKGNIIWIAESDDSCNELFLEILVDEYKRKNAILAFTRSQLIDEKSNYITEIQNQKELHGDYAMSGLSFLKDFLQFRNVVENASSAIFDKKAAQQLDTSYIDYKGAGDWLFWIQLCQYGNVVFINKPLNYFRQHSTNTTTQMNNTGTNTIETKRIYDYLYHNNLISLKEYQYHKEKQLQLIYKHVTNKKLKNKLMHMWHVNHKFYIKLILYKIYQHLFS